MTVVSGSYLDCAGDSILVSMMLMLSLNEVEMVCLIY